MTPTSAAVRFRGDDEGPNQERQMSFPIPPEFERAVLDRVRSGQYASVEEAVEEGLRRLRTELMDEATRETAPGRLWAQIEALRRGAEIPAEQAEEVMRSGRTDDFWGRAPMNPGANRLHVSIAPEMQQFIAKLIRAGLMGSPSSALVAAINRLDDEVLPEEEIETLRREIQIGIDEFERGGSYSREEVIALMKERMAGGRP